MRCPRCQTENRPGANFCKHCGLLLASNCPRCQAIVQDQASYCDHCGLAFQNAAGGWPAASAAPAPQIAAVPPAAAPAPTGGARRELDQLISQEMRAKLDTARAERQMVGERRVVSILFCDIKGSTSAAERLDPEEWGEIMNEAFEFMIRPIYKYEGTVARLMGDAILAFFGAPIAHEDDPQRAILAGMDIVQEFAPYRDRAQARWGIDVDVRVGINTGLVMVGQVGSDLRMEYTAMGDAINLAARMEQTAQPGTVQIAENTYRRVAPLFEFDDLGLVEVKGKDEPVHTYRPLRRKTDPGRLRGIQGANAALVGREKEWAKLKAAGDSLARGVGQIVFVIGEAGLGKSRLISELKQDWQRRMAADGEHDDAPDSLLRSNWYAATSFSYETTQPYSLFQRILRRLAGATASDSAETLRELLDKVVAEMPVPDRATGRKAFESLFGLPAIDGSPPLEGEQFQRDLFHSIKALWQERARAQPVITVLDDLNWADPASIELVEHLLALTETEPLLFLCATRPERATPAWHLRHTAEKQFSHRYTEILIQPLSPDDCRQLIENLLAAADVPPALRASILEKTEGNPLFVEEVVRTLLDSEAEAPGGGANWLAQMDGSAIDIPDNIQSLLTARIDRLQEDARRTLQLAALIGRTFYYRVLEMIANDVPEESLRRHLTALQQMDLIREEARQPELEYSFHHLLTQEAAYNTILLKQRRDFHRKVAEAIELLFADQVDEMATQLAHHFEQAQNFGKAVYYYMQAGNTAFRLYAVAVAIGHYRQAISFLDRVALDGDQVKLLYSRLGRALELDSQFAAALRNYEEMEALAGARSDRALELGALMCQATIYANVSDQNDPERGEALSRQALSLAQELGDEAAEAEIWWNQLNALRFSDRIDEAVSARERALQLARKLELNEKQALVANDLALALLGAGQPVRVREALAEARELLRQLDDKPMLADALSSASQTYALAGEYDQAMAFAEEAFAISSAIHNNWGLSFSRFGPSYVYWQLGDPERAIDMFETSHRYGEQAHFAVAALRSRAYLARIYGRLGQVERGLELARAGESLAARQGPPWRPLALAVMAQLHFYQGDLEEAARFVAECERETNTAIGRFLTIFEVEEPAARIALARGDVTQAGQIAAATIASIRRFGKQMYLPEALHLQSQVLLAAGDAEAAGAALAEGRTLAEATGARWALWQILAAQAELFGAQAGAGEARSLWLMARTIVEGIAERAGSEELRHAFLSLPEVQAIYSQTSQPASPKTA